LIELFSPVGMIKSEIVGCMEHVECLEENVNIKVRDHFEYLGVGLKVNVIINVIGCLGVHWIQIVQNRVL
jgi:predicted amidohydrolase